MRLLRTHRGVTFTSHRLTVTLAFAQFHPEWGVTRMPGFARVCFGTNALFVQWSRRESA